MGSPQYGRLMLDGEELVLNDPGTVESGSLVWSADGRFLAIQERDYSIPYPGTRVVVVDAGRRVEVGASEPAPGLCTPIRFDGHSLVYRHWHHRRGEHELRLDFLAE
jgi:hypothetical protein